MYTAVSDTIDLHYPYFLLYSLYYFNGFNYSDILSVQMKKKVKNKLKNVLLFVCLSCICSVAIFCRRKEVEQMKKRKRIHMKRRIKQTRQNINKTFLVMYAAMQQMSVCQNHNLLEKN